MITFFLKTFVNVTVSCITSSSSKVVQFFLKGLRAKMFGKSVKCEIQNTIFEIRRKCSIYGPQIRYINSL